MRKTVGPILFLLAATGVVVLERVRFQEAPGFVYLSGWALLVLMFALAGYNLRKRLSFLPLGNSASWLGFHIYGGYFSIFLLGMHIRWQVPSGWFEASLAALYFVVALSGAVGLYLSRSFPKRLTAFGGEVIYQRIPEIRRRLQSAAEAIALSSTSESQSMLLTNFYVTHAKRFFDRPRHFWMHFAGVRRPAQRLIRRANDLRRFSNTGELESLDRLSDLIRQKEGLDFHRSLQLGLKGWLFVHIPFTWSLLLFSFVHVILVFAFSRGA